MRHFRVTVTCQAVETSLMVCLNKELQKDQIHKICKACVKDNYDIHIGAVRVRHNDTTKWISLEQMVQELIDLKLYKIKWERIPVGMTDCHCGQMINIPEHIKPIHAIIRTFTNGEQIAYINLKTKIEYLKVDYAAYAAELNKQDLKLSFSPYCEGVFACLPKGAEDARVVIDCPCVSITWTESTLKYEMKCIKTEL